jgi:endonuclease YncB( thermonuclease family)
MRGGCAAVLTLFVLPAPGISAATEILPGPLPADLIRVIDGDTIEVRAHLWLGLELTTRVRLADIDAPELDGSCPAERELAKAARAFLTVTVSPAVTLRDVRQDKYGGRVVARVLTMTGEDIGHLLLAHRLAANAGSRWGWCP